jgi:DNA polymerase III subunit delta
MLKPVYALVGEDLFLQLQKMREILGCAPKDVQRIDLDGETAELAEVLDEVRSFAMFSTAKLVVVREADEFISRFREALEAYVARPAPDSALVLRVKSLPANQRIHKAIAARGQIHDCKPPRDAAGWARIHAKQAHGLTLSPPGAQLLVELVGNDLGRLDNELAKLALQSAGPAGPAEVQASVSFQREQEMWDMIDEVAAGNLTRALQRWRHLVQMDSSAEYRAITWLTMWLEKVRKALAMRRAGRSEGDIARELKIFPAAKQQAFFRNAATIGENGAARLIDQLADLDYRSKTGLGEMARNVERFLLGVQLG